MPKDSAFSLEIAAKAKEIHTDAYPMSIGELMALYRDGELEIHPEFQRFFRWTLVQKSKFIESILLGIPVPSIFVSQRQDGVWDVVDGVQRLSTIFEFIGILRDKDGNLVAPSSLVGTDYLPSLDGKVWEDDVDQAKSFPNAVRLDFKRQKLDLKIIKKESDENTRYDLFERLNTLGLGCTPFVRQKVKRQQHRVENSSCLRLIVLSQSAAVGEAEASSAGGQLARNSQLETHRDDEPGAAVTAAAPTPRTPHRIDRFPYA